jgi:hypothetical protein
MKNVGFCGGYSILELGPVADMQVFFYAVEIAASRLSVGEDAHLLTDRLYRRYLRLEELDQAADLLQKIQKIMQKIPTKSVDWGDFKWDISYTNLEKSKKSLADLLEKYFNSAYEIISDAKHFEERFKEYTPVMTAVTDLPRVITDTNRPLAEYDALEGEPIWLR